MNQMTPALFPPTTSPKGLLSRRPLLAIALAIGAFLALSAALIVPFAALLMKAMRSSDAYQVAVSTAAHDSGVVAELGAPVEPGWYMTGQIKVSAAEGHANLAIPITGSAKSGTLRVVADKSAGKWTFQTLSVQVHGRPTPIDLLSVPAPATPL
jgi:hypothetical protein